MKRRLSAGYLERDISLAEMAVGRSDHPFEPEVAHGEKSVFGSSV
jgi:hypothetical protein